MSHFSGISYYCHWKCLHNGTVSHCEAC